MNKIILVLIILMSIQCDLFSQNLTRKDNGKLLVKLDESKTVQLPCDMSEQFEVNLYKQVEKRDEPNCSRQRIWKKVFSKMFKSSKYISISNIDLGTYKAEIVNTYYCNERSKLLQVLETNVLDEMNSKPIQSTSSEDAFDIHVYPNPTVEEVFVNIADHSRNKEGVYNLVLISQEGKIILTINGINWNDGPINIPMEELPSGQYNIRIDEGGEILFSSKVVKLSK